MAFWSRKSTVKGPLEFPVYAVMNAVKEKCAFNDELPMCVCLDSTIEILGIRDALALKLTRPRSGICKGLVIRDDPPALRLDAG